MLQEKHLKCITHILPFIDPLGDKISQDMSGDDNADIDPVLTDLMTTYADPRISIWMQLSRRKTKSIILSQRKKLPQQGLESNISLPLRLYMKYDRNFEVSRAQNSIFSNSTK